MRLLKNYRLVIFWSYSAGKRDREKKTKAPLARAKEGPKAPLQARSTSTEEEAEGNILSYLNFLKLF